MYCNKCGKELQDNARFCTGCGASIENPVNSKQSSDQVQVKENSKKEKKPQEKTGSKKGFNVLSFLIGILLSVVLVAGLILAGLLSFNGNIGSGKAGSSTAKVEGEGYETPEDAVTAYMEALKAQDLDAMLSTFAVESYCENFDTMKQADRMQSYGMMLYTSHPVNAGENDFLQQFNIECRRRALTTQLSFQLLQLSADEDSEMMKVMNDGTMLRDDLEAETKAFISSMQSGPDFSTLEIKKIQKAKDVNENYSSEGSRKILKANMKILGADDLDARAITFKIDGRTGVLYMDVVKYGDHWYNYTPMGTLATLSDLPSTSGGIELK